MYVDIHRAFFVNVPEGRPSGPIDSEKYRNDVAPNVSAAMFEDLNK